ncbi:LGFP repeat-containing protein [Microbacterium trichothecenolyticum]|uniref:LGFP repeat-containing protein n=1 Tax=Microbacterium trichothecenolyticum TaxID=69370 RepID=UPI0027D76E15|nr:hypothetical protein [Microbacterium trichothecenolyticum]
MDRRIGVVVVALVALLSGLLVAVAPAVPSPASAANAADFQDGYLISDRNFLDSGSLTVDEVQSFLNAQVPTCRANDGMPCLKDYVAQSTPSLAANSYCSAFPGGTMSAARLIVTVSQVCGISPKVILVMLQKEQGLITDTSPSRGQYSAALGQGCPDGGVGCDPAFAGFFYQIYGAARQFQIYLKFPKSFSYQLGWNNILYQASPPDTSGRCGTKRVFIQNDATRALYVYTPYTPNQAALDNLYGTGDFCSAYGNRNFWRLYTDWFGNPVGDRVTGEYAAVWQALGGSSGVLGSPTSDVVCVASRYCQQSFRGGTIFWFPGRGVFGVPTVVETMWRNLGFIDGAPGFPTGVVVCAADGTCAQSFDGGVIAADSSGGSLVGRHVEDAWLAAGGVALGGARGPELCSNGTDCAQLFARAAFYSSAKRVLSVTGAIFTAWSAAGMSNGPSGFPTANAVCTSAGCTQTFSGGLIVSSGDRAQPVPLPIAAKFTAIGGLATTGAPVSAATCSSSTSCSQLFDDARIDTFPDRAAVATTKGFLDTWAASGFEKGLLRRPMSDASCSSLTCSQPFEGGVLVGTPSAGVVAVFGAYLDAWKASGGEKGSLGLPTGADSCDRKSCSQAFQRGVLVWTPARGVLTVSSWFLSPWQAKGATSGLLGAPTANASCSSLTCSQRFQGGVLVGTPSAGVVAVFGAYLDAWKASGGEKGSLGLPTGADSCDGKSCSQAFQRGVLVWTPARGVLTVSSWFLSPWQAKGATSGLLGAPTANASCSSLTCSQRFQGGVLVGTPSAGVVAVFGAYLDAWKASGGEKGSLGLPTGADSCDGNSCSISFQRGIVVWTSARGAITVAPPVFDAWQAAGGVSGRYGLPLSGATRSGKTITQAFERGNITAAG